jgi:biotin carboxyl carrier protein
MMKYTATVGERVYEIEIGSDNILSVDGERHAIDFRNIDGQSLYSLLLDNKSWEVSAEYQTDECRVSVSDAQYEVLVQDERTRKIDKGLAKAGAPTGEVTIRAPMPGLVKGIPVETWEEVKAGQGIVILEAMKMENELRAPRAGVISEIRVKSGDKVEQGQALVVIK